jgi:predicted MFS family arabinose efflux permease
VAPFIGWRGIMAVCAAAAALSCAVLVLEARGKPGAPPGPRPQAAEVIRRYAAILRLPAARPLYIGVFLEGIAVFGVFPFLAVLLAAPGGSGAAEAGLAVAAFGLGGFGYTMAAPLLLKRLGQGRMMRLAGLLAALGLAAIAAADQRLALGAAGAFALGCGFFMLHNSIQVRVTEVAPQARGSAVALHAFCFFMGQSVGPAVYGTGLSLAGPGAMLAVGAAGILAIGAWLGGIRPATRA